MSGSDSDDAVPIAVPLLGGKNEFKVPRYLGSKVIGDAAIDASGLARAAATDSGRLEAAAASSTAAWGQDDATRKPTPVTLITGYLGSGKTTLVNHVLSKNAGRRYAVLLNEIGESADIERALVKEPGENLPSALSSWVELENGCICCSAKSDMVVALETLLQQRDRFDAVLIEGTGLASPGPVAAELWPDAALGALACLDAIVAVVDAANLPRQLAEVGEEEGQAKGGSSGTGRGEGAGTAEPGTPAADRAGVAAVPGPQHDASLPPTLEHAVSPAARQIAYADVVVVNKLDLVDGVRREEVLRAVRAINGTAKVLEAVRSAVDPRLILDTGLYITPGERGEGAPAADPFAGEDDEGESDGAGRDAHAHGPSCRPNCGHEHEHEHEHGSAHGPRKQHTTHGISTITLRSSRPLDLELFRTWLESLLWGPRDPPHPDVCRVKAMVAPQTQDSYTIVQSVHDLYDVQLGRVREDPAAYPSKVVLIGRRLRRAELEEGLRRCELSD